MQSLISSKTQSWLVWFYKGLIVLGILILFTRLIELQIIKGAYYRNLAEGNRIRRVPIPAPRGKILARGGEVLVGNQEQKITLNFHSQSGFEKNPASPDTPPEDVVTEWQRFYELGARFGHVSGYLGEVNPQEVNKVDPNCPEKGPRLLGNFVGRTGLEEYYDCKLRGIDGEELIEVDTLGNKVRTIGRKNSLPGNNLQTTIDYNLQKVVSSRLKDKKGSVIITDPKGEILALYSSPSFDPNLFVNPSPAQAKSLQALFNDPSLPLFNRAVSGVYQPGSIFKPVTAVAALEEHAIDANYLYDDTGVITVNDFSYTNWYFTQHGRVEGQLNLAKAIARSTDTFFYKIGELVGVEKLSHWAENFSLGKPTGVDLPGEASGLVPSPRWKKAVKGEAWFLGNTYHFAIGQGDLSITPLEAGLIPMTIASSGQLCRPHLVNDPAQNYCHDLGISSQTLETIKIGMAAACSTGGTAYPFFNFQPPVACKTGTAEISDDEDTHAWFTVFAPLNFPEIVVTVFLEKGGEGSKEAAPVALEILDYWFHNRLTP